MIENVSTYIIYLALFGYVNVNAFTPGKLPNARVIMQPLKTATLEPNTKLKPFTELEPNTKSRPTTWECDEEINCIEVDACSVESCRTSLDVRIHGVWYDLSGK